jgi:hypothetical protein
MRNVARQKMGYYLLPEAEGVNLHRSPKQRTVAVTFADDEQGAAAERVIHQVVEFLPQLIQERQEETLKKVVNVLLTDVTPSKAAREQARMLIEAKTDILQSGDFLPATGVARLAGFSASNLSVQPNKWKRTGEIFAIQHGREDYLPIYALAPDHRPRKEVAEILNIFAEAKDGWGLAFWFAALNSKACSVLLFQTDFQLLDLSKVALRGHGIQPRQLIDTTKAHYPITRHWAEQVYAAYPHLQGFLWSSRQDGLASDGVGARFEP